VFLRKLWLTISLTVAARLALAASPQDASSPALPDPTASSQPRSSLDFDTYRSRIEPIFVTKRDGNTRCYDCHSALATRFRLEPFYPDNSSWTEEQSRRNLESVSRLINFSDPLKSPLLVHPLAPEAGGDPAHSGGKFWKSRSDPEWQMLAEWVRQTGQTPENVRAHLPSSPTDALDFEVFRTRVQPIFLKERPGHARCYGCHILPNRNFLLVPLPPGKLDWTGEQSQRNFQNVLRLVAPGDPSSSRLLLHPLAPEAGGDPFHSGGWQFGSRNDPDWLVLSDWVRGVRTGAAPDSGPRSQVRIYVTNSADDTVDVIDASTNQVVQVMRGIELPHGVAFSPDGTLVYVSNESESVLDVIDRKSGEILHKIPLSGRPNNIAITKDGNRVLVGIHTEPGAVDVIDTSQLKRVKSILVNGSVHNVYVTPDGKYAVSGSIENKVATVIALPSEQPIWEVKFDRGVRPMAFETNPDGSTSRIFVQLSDWNGFAIVDFAKRAEVARIRLPDQPGGFGIAEGRTSTPSHGIGVAPNGQSLWVNSSFANAVFEYSLPELKLIGYASLPVVHSPGRAPTGSVPEWITFTPDSKVVYISNSGARSISAVDTNTLKIVAVIPVGEVPKRIKTLVQ
jgi:YVTN family beta-propeller protein